MDSKYDCLLLRNQLCFPMYAVANKIVRRYQPLLDKLDLTYTQYIVMMAMWEKKESNEKELCKALRLKTNTLAPLLKRLKEKGFLAIRKDEQDKRNLVISLTEKGEALKEKAVDVPQASPRNSVWGKKRRYFYTRYYIRFWITEERRTKKWTNTT